MAGLAGPATRASTTTGQRGWWPRRRARSADVSAQASCGNPHLLLVGATQRLSALAPLPQHLAGTWCHWAGRSGKTDLQVSPRRSSATADRGGVGQLAREVKQMPHGVLAVGGLADPQREVIGRDRAQVSVVGLAVLVAAVSRLELEVR